MSPSQQQHAAQPADEFTDAKGIVATWHADGRVLQLTITDSDLAVVQGWQHIMDRIASDWPSEAPFLNIFELSADIAWFSSDARHAAATLAREFDTRYPDLHGRVAVVIPPTVRARFLRVFLETIMYDGPQDFEFEIFNNRDAALHWMQDYL